MISLTKMRLSSLDAFRGLTIAGMLLVNNPGSWKHISSPLKHAEWHGWTPADLVFPFFLFAVGISVSLTFSRRLGEGAKKSRMYEKIMVRTLILFALGMFLRLFPKFSFENLRIPGVLQRIALCYLFASLIFINTRWKGRLAACLALLAAYWLAMKLIPVPGYGAGVLGYEGNLCAFLDRKLLAGHLYKPGFDPEGILSTIPAIATTLLGALTGDWLRSSRNTGMKTAGVFIAGGCLTITGLLLHPLFPINKQLWTSTYVLFTAGAGLLVFGLFYGLMDGLGYKKWAGPLLVFGTNAIATYSGSIIMAKLMPLIKVSAGGKLVTLQTYIYDHLLVPWAGQLNGSLLFAVVFVLIWLLIMLPLYRKKIFVKI